MTPSCRVGCVGWSLNRSVSSLFPSDGSHLERYARVFSCVEINSSFYRSHQPKTYARWAESVPDDFRFSVKMPRVVTHDLRLQECEEAVSGFVAEVAHLGSRLGCILVQLPPSLAFDKKIATQFFALLRTGTAVDVVCEPRHASWFSVEAAAVLREADIACVRADPPPVAGIDDFLSDRGVLYIRLHGSPRMYYSSYDDDFLAGVAAQMRRAREQGRDAWCIFDNTAMGAAVPNALALLGQLSA